MIQMISGCTQIAGEIRSAKSGPFEASPQVEEFLVKRGVAKYVGRKPALAPGADVPPAPDFPMGDDAMELPPVPVQPDEPAPPDEADAETIDAADLTVAQLKDIAAQMGIETKGLRTKAALLEAIAAAKPPDPQVIA